MELIFTTVQNADTTHMVPSSINLFMLELECQILQTRNKLPLVRWKYINNVLGIWTHGKQMLQEFLRDLNQHHTTIKFTVQWSAREVLFLDARVYLRNSYVEMDLYVKPTDRR